MFTVFYTISAAMKVDKLLEIRDTTLL